MNNYSLTSTNVTITTKDGSTVRFEDILEGIHKNVEMDSRVAANSPKRTWKTSSRMRP